MFESWIKIVVDELSDITLFIFCDSEDVATAWCDCLSASQLCRSCAFVVTLFAVQRAIWSLKVGLACSRGAVIKFKPCPQPSSEPDEWKCVG